MTHALTRSFLRLSNWAWPNLAALFMRLFAGVMFLQFGVRQLVDYTLLAPKFPTVLGMSSPACLTLMIIIELLCSVLIIFGFLTRVATVPPIVSMILAEWYLLHTQGGWGIAWFDIVEPAYVPILFMGMFFYLLISGPGKISVDYLLSLKIVQDHNLSEEQELADE